MYAVSAEVKGLDTVVSLLSDAVLQPRLLGKYIIIFNNKSKGNCAKCLSDDLRLFTCR